MRRIGTIILCVVMVGAVGACSINRTAVDMLADAIGESSGVYASDGDPDLVLEAIPFGLKAFESLLAVSPDNPKLLIATASGFAGYAYLLQQRADLIDSDDLRRARRLRARVHGLFLRGRDYALRALERAHPGFTAAIHRDVTATLARTTWSDTAALYWAGVAWAGALGARTDDLDLVAQLPAAAALVGRVIELDKDYQLGAAHDFFIAYEGGRPGGSAAEARRHYRRAVELSGGRRAAVHVALAEAVTVADQDVGAFRALLDAALAVDADAVAELRLVNTVAHRRARWLRSRIPDLFLVSDPEQPPRRSSSAPSRSTPTRLRAAVKSGRFGPPDQPANQSIGPTIIGRAR